MNMVKFIGAWFCIVAAVVLLVFEHRVFGLPGTLALLAVAFATAPATW